MDFPLCYVAQDASFLPFAGTLVAYILSLLLGPMIYGFPPFLGHVTQDAYILSLPLGPSQYVWILPPPHAAPPAFLFDPVCVDSPPTPRRSPRLLI